MEAQGAFALILMSWGYLTLVLFSVKFYFYKEKRKKEKEKKKGADEFSSSYGMKCQHLLRCIFIAALGVFDFMNLIKLFCSQYFFNIAL